MPVYVPPDARVTFPCTANDPTLVNVQVDPVHVKLRHDAPFSVTVPPPLLPSKIAASV
jgi:hypothetical protein